MELRVLRYFLTAARENSITKAAKFLHVTQPTLSRQLQELEEELGQKLMIRNNHTFALTPEGMLLRKRAEEVLEIIHKTEAEFGSFGKSVAGDVYIGGGETDAMRLPIAVMKAVQTEYPDVHFHVYSGNADDVMERLDQGRLDFGVLIQPVDISKYDSIPLPVRDTWGVLMPSDHPLAVKTAVTPSDLLGVPLLSSRVAVRHSGIRNATAEWFGKSFEKLNIVGSYNLIYNAALMVKGGLGCALVMDKLANVEAVSGLCFRPLEPRLETGLDIVWKKYQVFSPAAKVFLERLRERFEQ